MESVHPIVVHFPIALLLTALGLDALALVLRREALHRVALWNLVLGTVGAAATVLTGLQAERVAKHTFEIHQVMELHKRLGLSTLALAVALSAWRLIARHHLALRGRLALLLAGTLLAGAVIGTGYLGGRLVYEFGVGGTFGR